MMTKEEMAKIIAENQRQVDEQNAIYLRETAQHEHDILSLRVEAQLAVVSHMCEVSRRVSVMMAKPKQRITVAM